MRTIMKKLWADDCGALIATEWLFLATIMVIGLVTGLVTVRNYVVAELSEFGQAVGALDQSYGFYGLSSDGTHNFSNGTRAIDQYADQDAKTNPSSPFITGLTSTSNYGTVNIDAQSSY